VIEVFIDELHLAALGFDGMAPAATGRPAYHSSTPLKIYLYGYLYRLQSSRRLEREASTQYRTDVVGRATAHPSLRRATGAAVDCPCARSGHLKPDTKADT
jgi:transposase